MSTAMSASWHGTATKCWSRPSRNPPIPGTWTTPASSSIPLTIRFRSGLSYAGDGTGDLASVEYRIMVPRNANLQNVKLTNGGLSIRGLAGAVKASAVNGGIRAERLEGGGRAFDRQRAAGCRFRADQRLGDDLADLGERPHPAVPSAEATASLVAGSIVSGGINSDIGRSCREPGGNHLRAVMNRGGVQNPSAERERRDLDPLLLEPPRRTPLVVKTSAKPRLTFANLTAKCTR